MENYNERRAEIKRLERQRKQEKEAKKGLEKQAKVQAQIKQTNRRKAVYVKEAIDDTNEYRGAWAKSRGVDPKTPHPCEQCWTRRGIDVHHEKNSYRGKRTHNPDGSDLKLLCRTCHDRKHGH